MRYWHTSCGIHSMNIDLNKTRNIMSKIIKGKTILYLSESDPSGNFGYSLAYNYSYNTEDILGSFSYTDLAFSGSGNWEDYSSGDEYPVDKMMQKALSDQDKK